MKRPPRAITSQMERLIETALAPGRFVSYGATFSFVSELETVQHEHVLIYEAIKQEDPVAAREAMRTHINNARIRVLTDSTEP